MATLFAKLEALAFTAPSFRWRIHVEVMELDKIIASSVRARDLTGPAL
jgi:hypothetical protein